MSTPPPGRPSRRGLLAGILAAAAVGSVGGCGGTGRERHGLVDSAPDPTGLEMVQLRVDGETLRPKVELGSEVDVTWWDLDSGARLGTGTEPTLTIREVRRVGIQVTSGRNLAFDQVLTLNLGFNRDDDYGRLSLDSFYEHDPQPVTAITGLPLLTHLVRLCASRTPLSGRLDLTGLSHLEHVECYRCEIDSLDLTGCSGLVRLCVEDCRLSELDLAPVRRTLQDLRAAIQRSGSMTFVPLDGPMEALYHYCVRGQQVRRVIPHSQLPVVEEYWASLTGQRTCDSPISPVLRSYLVRDNALDQVSVDAILTGLASHVTGEPGLVDLTGRAPDGEAAAPPSPAGEAAAGELLARGWRVSTN